MVFKRRNKLFKYAVDLFVELLEQVTKRKQDHIKVNAKDRDSWNVFMDYYQDKIGEDFIRKFIQYGFQSWFNDGSKKDYSRSIKFNWVIGVTSIKRWEACSVRTNIFITRMSLKTDYKINNLPTESKFPELLLKLRPNEEKFKEAYLNSQKGMAWCIANTTLYFHKSSNCAVCKFKSECRNILKKEYPKINKIRGYGE